MGRDRDVTAVHGEEGIHSTPVGVIYNEFRPSRSGYFGLCYMSLAHMLHLRAYTFRHKVYFLLGNILFSHGMEERSTV